MEVGFKIYVDCGHNNCHNAFAGKNIRKLTYGKKFRKRICSKHAGKFGE
jgi:hypothetical protein